MRTLGILVEQRKLQKYQHATQLAEASHASVGSTLTAAVW